jgi:hypothetical protein
MRRSALVLLGLSTLLLGGIVLAGTFVIASVLSDDEGRMAIPPIDLGPDGGGGGTDAGRDPDDDRKAPRVMPAGPYPGQRVPVALPARACSEDADSAPAIEAFLETVPNGSRVAFPAGARCRIDRSVSLSVPEAGATKGSADEFRAGMVFDLNGATLFRPAEPSCPSLRDCNGPIVALSLVWDIRLVGGTIAGGAGSSPSYDPTREHDHGVSVHGASAVILEDLTIERVAGDCVDVDRRKRTSSVGVAFIRSTCRDAGRQGISANEVEGLLVAEDRFERIDASAVDLEARRNGYIRDARVEGNEFAEVGHAAVAGVGASEVLENVTIRGNRQLDDRGLHFLFIGNGLDRGPLTVRANEVMLPSQVKHMTGSAAGTMMRGTQPLTPCLFVLINSPDFVVEGNDPGPGLSEACTIDADYGDWNGRFALRAPVLTYVSYRAALDAEFEHLSKSGCARDVRLLVEFLRDGEVVASAQWGPAELGPEDRPALSVGARSPVAPDAVLVRQTSGDCD